MKRTLWGQEVKDQGHRKPKLDLEAWRRHHSRTNTGFLVKNNSDTHTAADPAMKRSRTTRVKCTLAVSGMRTVLSEDISNAKPSRRLPP